MTLCKAITLEGITCSKLSSIATNEGIAVCKKHSTFTIAKGKRFIELANIQLYKKDHRELIEQLNREILEGHSDNIPLLNKYGLIVDFALVDAEDYTRLMKHSWHKNEAGYAIKAHNGDTENRMHRFVMGDIEEGMLVDHKDGNRLNNKKSNLRVVTASQNTQNRNLINEGSKESKYIGVYKRKNRWFSRCSRKNLGTFDTEIEAARRYDIFVILKFGPESKTNGLVTAEQITITFDDFENKNEQNLPDNINLNKGLFVVYKRYHGKVFTSSSKSLSKAKSILEKFNKEIEYIKAKEEAEHISKEIKRNKDGHAIIEIFNKKSERVCEVIVDDDKWHELMRYSWNKSGKYHKGTVSGVVYLMHRFLMKAERGEIIDHINGNTSDNRLQNLRKATSSVNSHNTISRGEYLYKGVTYDKHNDKWTARIAKDNISYKLGTYDIEVQAAIAFNIKSEELYGDCAHLNKISEEDMAKNLHIVQEKMRVLLELQKKNMQNKKKYRGVYKSKDTLWFARIKHNRKDIYIGSYKTEVEAALAYNQKSKELLGEKAKLNVITD
jgi:hypothetical protein